MGAGKLHTRFVKYIHFLTTQKIPAVKYLNNITYYVISTATWYLAGHRCSMQASL